MSVVRCCFYDALGIVDYLTSNRRIDDLEGSGRHLIEVQSRYFSWELKKTTKLGLAGEQPGIGTEHLPNASVQRYCQISLFGMSLMIFIFFSDFTQAPCSRLKPQTACFDILPSYKTVCLQRTFCNS
jgi:hypothetical protein